MASGLAALLDDVAAIAKLASASLDDVSAAAGKASAKAAGVVVDDTAVTPAYVTGFSPERELPMIGRIALGSLRNKLLLLLPAALLLSAFLPMAITPLLMLGGAFLCFEGAEKIIESITGHGGAAETAAESTDDPAHLETAKVKGAVRTDLILSAEILAIALADLAQRPIAIQAAALVVVSLLVTFGVYGVVAIIVKLDDIGLHLAQRQLGITRALGRFLVRLMPHLLTVLKNVGMIAMLWVGGGIIVHGLAGSPLNVIPKTLHHWAEAVSANAAVIWIANAALAALTGFAVGLAVTGGVHLVQTARGKGH